MFTTVRILCILSKYHHLTDLLHCHWFLIRQRLLFKVLVKNYQVYFIFYNARDLRSNNKLLINP